MDIRDFRKNIFINSQYCTYYIDGKDTVLAGIMRSNGYRIDGRLSVEKLEEIGKNYRKFTTILNCAVGAEILFYVYLVIFPYFIKFIQMPYYLMILMLSIIPLVGLFLTYVVVNRLYENYLSKQFGELKNMPFKPTVYNIEPETFDKYLKTPRKSVYVAGVLALIFLYYAFTPAIIENFNKNERYKSALFNSNLYLKVIPVNADVYAQKAYAEYKLEKYNNAIRDFGLANKYSMSNVFDFDILGIKLLNLSFEEAIIELDNAISSAEKEEEKFYLMSEKAIYLQQNKHYKEALDIYNKLVWAYKNKKDYGFAIDFVYHQRGVVRGNLGDTAGSKADLDLAQSMCSNCKFELKSTLVGMP